MAEKTGLVPEEAIRAAMGVAAETFEMPFMARVRDFTDEQVRAGELRAADEEAGRKNMAAVAAVVEAAAPLILAAAYDRLADELAAERDSGRFGLSGSFGSGIQRAVLKIQQAASVLRGEGHRDG